MTQGGNIRVLVCDDSALIRQILTRLFEDAPGIELVGTAPNPHVAREKIKALNPDVLTLDIEMPGMDGLSFLEKIMTLRPMPVVMISSLTTRGSAQTLRALELGVVDVVAKPTTDLAQQFKMMSEDIISKVRAAASARISGYVAAPAKAKPRGSLATRCKMIAIGASTGGVGAIKQVITQFTPEFPPTVIVQHMPATFTGAFAQRMNLACDVDVFEAEDGMSLKQGQVAIAPGAFHLTVHRTVTGGIETQLDDSPRIGGHKPSVDRMFASVAKSIGRDAVGVILTGMGRDGARGLFRMRQAGAPTVGQDEATSVIFGMPRAAQEVGAVDHVEPIGRIADRVSQIVWPAQDRVTQEQERGHA